MKKRTPALISLCVAAFATWGTTQHAAASQVGASDTFDARNALLSGLRVEQELLVPTKAMGVFAPAMVASQAHDATMRNAMKKRANAEAAKYFHGSALRSVLDAAGHGIDDQAEPSFEVLDGGADSLTVDSTDVVDSSTLHIKGTVRTWLRMAQIQPQGAVEASSSNIIDYDVVMVKNNGKWTVDAYKWSFHPGFEP